MMPRWTVFLLLCLAMTLRAFGDDATDQQIAMRFYPDRLDANFRENHSPAVTPTQIASSVRVDLDRTGVADYLAVAYSNGFAAALRIIKGDSLQTAILIAESGDETMGGRGRPALFATDIDNDGTPELVLEFPHATWIYQFHSQTCTLTPFGPTVATSAGVTSYLGDAAFIDIDGDGVLEIVEFQSRSGNAPEEPETTLPTVNRLTPDGTFTPIVIRLVFFDRFFMADATDTNPQPPSKIETRSFAATSGDYQLRIVNGDQNSNFPVASVEIRLNGATILSSTSLNQTRVQTIPVALLDNNILTVEIRSDPGSELSIVIARGL